MCLTQPTVGQRYHIGRPAVLLGILRVVTLYCRFYFFPCQRATAEPSKRRWCPRQGVEFISPGTEVFRLCSIGPTVHAADRIPSGHPICHDAVTHRRCNPHPLTKDVEKKETVLLGAKHRVPTEGWSGRSGKRRPSPFSSQTLRKIGVCIQFDEISPLPTGISEGRGGRPP
jgi:hypothetical protein